MVEKNNFAKSSQLTDEELGNVTGGYGQWDVDSEMTELAHYNAAHDPKYTTFEEFVTGYWGADHAAARQAWIEAGSPKDRRYICSDNGMLRSERLIPAPARPRTIVR